MSFRLANALFGVLALLPWLLVLFCKKEDTSGITLLITGGRQGNIAPCKCASQQLGGLSQEAAQIEKLRQRSKLQMRDFIPIELGDSILSDDEVALFLTYFSACDFKVVKALRTTGLIPTCPTG
jgi:hypothetical protein